MLSRVRYEYKHIAPIKSVIFESTGGAEVTITVSENNFVQISYPNRYNCASFNAGGLSEFIGILTQINNQINGKGDDKK